MHFIQALFTVYALTHHVLADEPTGPLSYLSPAAVRVLASHTHGYQAIVFWQGRHIAPYVGSFNHLWCDDYPFWRGVPGGLNEWWETVHHCVTVAHRFHLPPPLMVGQAFGGSSSVSGGTWRLPTRWEHWKMIQIAKQQGAAGILWWTHA